MFCLALGIACLREACAGPKDSNDEEVSAEVTEVSVFSDLLLATQPPVDVPWDPLNNTASLSGRFEQLMNSCVREVSRMRAAAWDGVKVVAVVAVSLAEARLLCSTFTGFELLVSWGDAKGMRLSLQPAAATPQYMKPRRASSVPSSGAVLSARRLYIFC